MRDVLAQRTSRLDYALFVKGTLHQIIVLWIVSELHPQRELLTSQGGHHARLKQKMHKKGCFSWKGDVNMYIVKVR